MTGGECLDAGCRLRTTTSRQLVSWMVKWHQTELGDIEETHKSYDMICRSSTCVVFGGDP